MYFACYWTDAHRIGFGIDVFMWDGTLPKRDALHIEVMLWKWVLNISFGRRSK